MLLIGSRAIRVHFPEFRQPRDWDIVCTAEDIAALARKLPPVNEPPKAGKARFWMDGAIVEMISASASAYWHEVLTRFDGEPTIVHDVLGELALAPVPYIILSKQCALVYGGVHWHKNLEDLCFLWDRQPDMPEDYVALGAASIANSAEHFLATHTATAHSKLTCHPSEVGVTVNDPGQLPLHVQLHELLAGPGHTTAASPGWRGFPERRGADRTEAMLALVTEEVLVMAAQQGVTLRALGAPEPEDVLVRWALRQFATGKLPVSWRYFLVNHYREIVARVPRGWSARLPEASALQSCSPRE
jgi:hypothetical protein